jgi:DNA-binding beta-propeller fold protein YncE
VHFGKRANPTKFANLARITTTHTVGNQPLWLTRENGPANNLDAAQAVAASPDSTRIFVTGLINGIGPDEEYATVAYEAATGRKLWLSRYNGSPCLDTPVSIAVSPDGSRVFVTGYSGCLSGEDYATVAYDTATGQELWVNRYNGPTGDPDEPYAITVAPDAQRIFVTGRSFGLLGEGRDYATVAYDAVTGEERWVARYVGPGIGEENSDDEAYALGVSPDGGKVFVTGASNGSRSSRDYATLAYDATTGGQLWLSRYNGPANAEDFAEAIAVSPDGSKVFVTGYSYGPGTFSDYATASYDAATGVELWLHRYDGPVNGFDFAYAIAVSPDARRVFVTGNSDGAQIGFSDYLTLAYNSANGSKVWLRRYNGPGNGSDESKGIKVSPDGTQVFVTGFSSGLDVDFPFDFTTLAYETNAGRRLWINRFNGVAHHSDLPSGLTVSPDGSRLFVTGSSDGVDSWTDWATLAYAVVAGNSAEDR